MENLNIRLDLIENIMGIYSGKEKHKIWLRKHFNNFIIVLVPGMYNIYKYKEDVALQ